MRAYGLLLTLLPAVLVASAGAAPAGGVALIGYVEPPAARQVELAGTWEKGRGWSTRQKADAGHWLPSRWRLFRRPDATEKRVTSRPEFESDEFGNVWYPLSGVTSGGLATTAEGNIRPRKAKRRAVSSRQLRQWTTELLRRHGLRKPAPPRITEAWQVDLDGDGSDEILWTARSRDREHWAAPYLDSKIPTHALPSDYALVGLAHRSGARTVLHGLAVDAANSAAPEYRLLCPLDLDRDGRMEIYTYASYFEEHGLLAFTFDGRTVRGILGTRLPAR